MDTVDSQDASPSKSDSFSRRDWTSLIALTAAQFINILDFMMVMPLGPRYREQFGMTPEQFGHIVASYGFAAFVGGIAASGLIDRFERKIAMLVVFAMFAISTCLCGLATDYASLLIARSATGVFGGFVGSMTMTIVGDVYIETRRGFALGIIGMAFSIASILGIPLALWIADVTLSVRAPFFVLALIAALVFCLLWVVLPRLHGHLTLRKQSYWSTLKSQLSIANHQLAYLFTVLLVFGSFTVAPYIATYMVSNVGLENHQVKYIYIVGGLASFAVMPTFGKITDRFGKLPLFITLASLATLPTLIITNLTEVTLSVAIIATTCYMAITSGRMIPAQALLVSASKPAMRAGFMSVVSAVQHLSSGLAASLSALILGGDASSRITNFSWVGGIAIASALLSLPVAWRLNSQIHQSNQVRKAPSI
jgi:predicted MFS family arabinose efflux permease